MIKRIAVLVVALLSINFSFAQLKSPEQFLGYKVGTHFTPHWRIIEYFKHVAAAQPATVKLEQYGTTNEGRPLVVVFVSSSQNISNLETIRTSNLRIANDNRNASTNGIPAIVWLSYNVHGNESSSTEASMLTLYSLVDPGESKTKQWLQNTVVVIDPCLNPDGRDRYVNWYNTIAGKMYNPQPDAREHNEPWPGGRVNHYNFDLNRDWAWQTQVESQQRVAIYNKWLPHIHVDFHEQGVNSPYYFAPAAQPYHEVITQWQRDFQTIIGRNHAKYFDEKAWLYFTKEEFDLTYPAYGDTYPLYNGSIGMTYEQAGNGRAGLGILQETGDTLTLVDRAQHHFTTSLSTIEVASQNASRLVSEFKKFYAEANAGMGQYKSYVIKYNVNDLGRIESLLNLLDKNGIRYGTSKGSGSRGFNYSTGKEESFSVAREDIVVSALQPKSALVKVLFEPSTVLVDTLAYDITAWSLPYAYGVRAYATRDVLSTGSDLPYLPSRNSSNAKMNEAAAIDAYGYVIPWGGINTVKLVSQLMQKGVKLRYNERPFEVSGQSFDRGAVLVLRTSNQYYTGLRDTVLKWADEYRVAVKPVFSGFVDKGFDFGSSKVHSIRPRRVALLTGEGVSSGAAGEIWYYFEQEINYPITLINATDIPDIHWNDYDVIIMPDGNYRFLNDKETADRLKSWISGGGNLVALERAVTQLSRFEWAIKSKKEDTTTDPKDIYESLKKFEGREREYISSSLPGSIFKVELDNTHPLAFGYPGYYYTLKTDDQVYEFIKEGGWNVGVLKKDKQVAGFVGSRLQNRLQDGLLFGVQEIGRGNITYLADDVLFRSFWENGKLMFANAVFLVGQ